MTGTLRRYQSRVLGAKRMSARKAAAIVDLKQLPLILRSYMKMPLCEIVQRFAVYGGNNGVGVSSIGNKKVK